MPIITNQEIYSHKQYMQDSHIDEPAAHRRYFGQFVTDRTIARVSSVIGKARILASTDKHMNDIPLIMWDRLTPQLPGSAGFSKAGDYYTLSNGVCLAKEAAKQWKEKQE